MRQPNFRKIQIFKEKKTAYLKTKSLIRITRYVQHAFLYLSKNNNSHRPSKLWADSFFTKIVQIIANNWIIHRLYLTNRIESVKIYTRHWGWNQAENVLIYENSLKYFLQSFRTFYKKSQNSLFVKNASSKSINSIMRR